MLPAMVTAVCASRRPWSDNQTRTAEQLRLGSATLYRKLKRSGLIGGRRTRTR